MRIQNLLINNVIPLYFEGKEKNSEECIMMNRLGTGFIIGSIGKFILVATAHHIYEDLEHFIKYLDGSKKPNLHFIPLNDDEKIETKNIGRHEVTGYITINDKHEQKKCFMDAIFGATKDSSDLALIVMRIEDDNYKHVNSLTISLESPHEGDEVHIYAFSEHETCKISNNLYKTTAVLNTQSGKVTSEFIEEKGDISTSAFSFNASSDGGNSGGLVYKIDNGHPIACGIISRSSTEHSKSNKGTGYTVAVKLAHLMRYSYKKHETNDNPLLQIDKMPYILGFVVHNIIKIIESEFLISIDDDKQIGVKFQGNRYIPIS